MPRSNPYMTLREFMRENSMLTKEAFLARYQSSFIVLAMPTPEEDPEFDTWTASKINAKGTSYLPAIQSIPLPSNTTTCAIALTKPEGEYHMISVGRASNSDICVVYSHVSKFHAYFKKDMRSHEMMLVDPGSTNGTQVNGRKLAPKESHVLEDGDKVVFARVIRGAYHTSEGMWSFIAQRDRAAQPRFAS